MEQLCKFIALLIGFTLFFTIGYAAGKASMEEQLQDKEIQLNICNATTDLFKEDFDKFCEERFEKMGC